MKTKEIRQVIGRVAAPLVAAALLFTATGATAADPGQYSEAERQMFVRPHLAAVMPPARLHYRYQRTGTLEPEMTDQATIRLGGDAATRTASVQYLSDERKLELPALDYVDGNPIILYFFEREVREMKRLTGGSVGYYRNRIRKALADDAKVREITVSHNGKIVEAIEIRIDPYLDDPARSRFEKFADRFYVMVLSPDVPGEVMQLTAELPGVAAGPSAGMTRHREVLTFERQDSGG